MKKLILLISFIVFGITSQATVHTVTSKNNGGTGSLRSIAGIAVFGDTIRFSPSLLASGSDSIVLLTEINFGNKGVVIKGLYNTSDTLFISGNQSTRIFSFHGSGRIVLDSLALINANVVTNLPFEYGWGGAVLVNNCTDTLFVKNSFISGNSAGSSGGGIYNRSSISSPKSVIFITNSVITKNSSGATGGGVCSVAYFDSQTSTSVSSVFVFNSTISGNNSLLSGGGIYAWALNNNGYNQTIAKINLTNSEISGNTAADNIGGGVWAKGQSSNSILVIDSSNILNNSGTGVSFLSSCTSTISNSNILGNTREGINMGSSAITITNSNFIGNGLSGIKSTGLGSSTLTATNSNFKTNLGPAIHLDAWRSSIILEGSEISGNSSMAVFSYGRILSKVIVRNTMITGNGAPFGVNINGGGIYSYANDAPGVNFSKSYVEVSGSSISGNGAGTNGGGIYSYAHRYDSASVVINNSFITGNTAGVDGGGIYCGGEEGSSSFIVVNGSTISGNTATGKGGGIYNASPRIASINLTNSSVLNNTSGSSGGGVFSTIISSSWLISFPSSVTLVNSEILGNISGSNGGGVFSSSFRSSAVNLTNSKVSGNMASNNGGGIYSYTFCLDNQPTVSKIELSKSTISGNTAVDGGGLFSWSEAIDNDGSSALSSMVITGSTISSNTATGNGGAVYSKSISRCPNSYNKYAISESSSSLTLSSSTISGNTTEGKGGGIYSFSSSDVTSNISASSASSISSVTVGNSTIYGNTALDSAGGIYSFSDATGPTVITFSSLIPVSGSVIAENGIDSSGIFNSHSPAISSTGYNVFSDTLSGTIGSDSVNISAAQLNLLPLAFNGGSTQTMMPSLGSVAIDSGNPSDTSAAQNVPISGVRERGAAEYCTTTHGYDTITACGSYTWLDGINYTSSDTIATHIILNAGECDSIIHLHLTLLNTYAIDTVTSCNSYTWIDSVTYTDENYTAMHVLTNSMGCDSLVKLNLTITNTYFDTVTACDSYTWRNGTTYTQSNSSLLDTSIVNGSCDSVFYLNLIINNTEFSREIFNACDSLTWRNGVTYYSSTNAPKDTLINRNGCDSIVALNLTINNSQTVIDTVNACLFYTWSNGQIYLTSNNTATQSFINSYGCDSTVTLNLEIHYGTFGVDTQMVCDSLVWIDGNTYYTNNTTATYTLVGGNSNGCDSVIILNLTVNGTHNTDVIASCSSYTWLDGVTYTSNNNTATHTTTNSLGCDSTVTLDLTIINPSNGTHVISACGSYTWNGITYTVNNNTAQDTLVNSAGCDSIVTLNLTILNPTVFTDVITSCNAITWIDGNIYSASNNTATHVLVAANGCDSIVTLDFTLMPATTATDVVSSCTEFTWIDGITYNQTTNGPTFTIGNAAGCDSVVTLDFTLLEVDTAVIRNYLTLTAQATNAAYQWIDCASGIMTGETNANFTATVNGSYQVAVNQNGCVDTSACFSITNVGITNVSLQGITLYPNPTSDQLYINKGSNQKLDIVITNSNGSEVFRSISTSQITTVNMSQYATGMYVVTMKNELGVKVEQVVKR